MDLALLTRNLDADGARLDATLAALKHDDFTRLMASADRIETMIDDECARQMDCAPTEVEYRLDARAAMDAKIAASREYDAPYGYSRGRY